MDNEIKKEKVWETKVMLVDKSNVNKLEEYLNQEWQIMQVEPSSGSEPAWLVIIEKVV